MLTAIAGHQHHHQKRDVVWVTKFDYATVEAANVVVYVDHQGNPVNTATVYNNQPGPTPQPEPAKPEPPNPEPPKQEPPKPVVPAPQQPSVFVPAPQPIKPVEPVKPAPPPPPKEDPKPSPPAEPVQPAKPAYSAPAKPPAKEVPESKPASDGSDFGSGISYSPYNADNSCKSTSQVASDLQAVRGYSVIRLYGTDCNQVANVIEATKGKGITLFLGIFDLSKIPEEAQTIISAVNGDWNSVNAVSVGNELVNSGRASVGQVTAAIGQARDILNGAGYTGPVVTVDTMVAVKANPELCHASDFCAINCHAFFDGNVLPDGAGDFVQQWADLVSEAANGKTVIVTESGWPSQGKANNKAVPSKENQAAAIDSIRLKLGKNVILYNAFNDLWKVDRGDTFGAEKFWGIYGDAPSHSG